MSTRVAACWNTLLLAVNSVLLPTVASADQQAQRSATFFVVARLVVAVALTTAW